ncbi:peptidase S8/S53 domain-containing protein [Trametes elegans]|nr:peptidase S8/S53 domain-containing protein [Trametes elegans]
MIVASLIFVCLVGVFVNASPAEHALLLFESREDVPPGFVLSRSAPTDTILDLRLALVQNDIPGLHKALDGVSNPDSPSYGHYLSKKEVEKFVMPRSETTAAVNAWLRDHNITAKVSSPAGDWLDISIPVKQANNLLDADFSVFTHEATGLRSIRTLSYSIPRYLAGHIQFVHPTISFISPRTRADTFVPVNPVHLKSARSPIRSQRAPASCTFPVTPQCILDLYDVPSGTIAGHGENVLLVTGYDESYANEDDLKTFLTLFRPDIPADSSFFLLTLNNGSNPQNLSLAGGQADIDIQYTVGVATGVNTAFLSVGAPVPGHEAFTDTANYLLSQTGVTPSVVTASYYYTAESSLSPALAQNLCNAYAQLGLRGTSVIFGSGDDGVGTGNCTPFVPTFPNGCPFVTSVAATTDFSPESARKLSSGGFSNYFSVPSYQQAAVASYLSSLGSTYAGLYNRTGRGYPDVAAQGSDLRVVVKGVQESVRGTDCASPIFASIIALLNDALLSAGRPTLGFLNPFLYSAKGVAALTDVTSGSNPGCGTNGFPAKAGWDPVTGLGTPNYAKLAAALGLSLQDD